MSAHPFLFLPLSIPVLAESEFLIHVHWEEIIRIISICCVLSMSGWVLTPCTRRLVEGIRRNKKSKYPSFLIFLRVKAHWPLYLFIFLMEASRLVHLLLDLDACWFCFENWLLVYYQSIIFIRAWVLSG